MRPVNPRHWWLLAIGAALLSLTALGGFFLLHYHPSRFSGDGRIQDLGFWSYPRYVISFPAMKVAEQKTAKFSAQGLPWESMSFQLVSIDHSLGQSLRMLLGKGSHLTVHIYEDGRRIAHVSAPVADWVVRKGPDEASLWHPNLRDVPFSTWHEYRFDIEIVAPELFEPELILEPRISGGGNETP